MDESDELLFCVFCDRLKAICSLSEELVFCDLFRDANVRLNLFQFHCFSFVLSNLVETIVLWDMVVQWIKRSLCNAEFEPPAPWTLCRDHCQVLDAQLFRAIAVLLDDASRTFVDVI